MRSGYTSLFPAVCAGIALTRQSGRLICFDGGIGDGGGDGPGGGHEGDARVLGLPAAVGGQRWGQLLKFFFFFFGHRRM